MDSNLLLIAQLGFAVLTLIFIALLVRLLKRGIDRTAWDDSHKKKVYRTIIVILFVWITFVSVWSLSGIMSDFGKFPFNFFPVVAIPLISMILLISFSKTLAEILKNISPSAVINLQVFRVFVEILLWILFIDNIIPVQMTFEGLNFDVLSGLTAPIIAWLVSRNKISKGGLVAWNVICLGLLVNIVTIAILSTPSPVRVFMNDPSNTIVTYFPVSLLPGFLVPLAYTLHFFSLKQVLSAPGNHRQQT